jgi:GNAT superfamily N-acetyltransferase
VERTINNIEIKPATADDWKIIQSIAHATWPVTYGGLLAQGQLAYMLELIYEEVSIRRQMSRGQEFFIGYHVNEPAGFASVERQYKEATTLMIHKLYVLPSLQGKGVGKAFLDYLTALAMQTSHDRLMLKVFVRNQNAIRFYLHQGFHFIGNEVTMLGEGYEIEDCIMVKEVGC